MYTRTRRTAYTKFANNLCPITAPDPADPCQDATSDSGGNLPVLVGQMCDESMVSVNAPLVAIKPRAGSDALTCSVARFFDQWQVPDVRRRLHRESLSELCATSRQRAASLDAKV